MAYLCCKDLHPDLDDKIAWLAVMGTYGDLGSSIKWDPPMPDMQPTVKQHGKGKLSQAVSLINARKLSRHADHYAVSGIC